MKIKKSFSLIALAAILGSSLAACGGTTSLSVPPASTSNVTTTTTSESKVTSAATTTTSKPAGNTSTVAPLEITSVSIANKAALKEKWTTEAPSRTIEIDFESTKNISLTDAMAQNLITISSSNPTVVSVTGRTLTGLSAGETTIKVKAGELTDTVNITIVEKEYLAPEINISMFGAKAGVEGETITFPAVTATDQDGVDITSNITVKCLTDENAVVTPTTFKSDVKGEHVLEFTCKNPGDESKVATKQMTINVYRKVLGELIDQSFSMTNEYSEDANQTVVSSNGGFAKAKLNLAPSQYYFAEATFGLPAGYNGGHLIGISNYATDSRFLAGVLPGDDFNHTFADMNTDEEGGWNIPMEKGCYSYQLTNYRLFGLTAATTSVKYTMIRKGEWFYIFVNDRYVSSYSDRDYVGVDTVPGFYWHNPAAGMSAYNIDFWSGSAEEIQAKIDEKSNNGAGFIDASVPSNYALKSQNIDNRNFTVGETTAEKGINFKFTNTNTEWNDGIVSPYIYFDGDFTMEFDYKLIAKKSETEPESRFWLEFRNKNYGDAHAWIGTKFGYADNAEKIEQMVNHGEGTVIDPAQGDVWNASTITDPKGGCHYKVTRRIANGVATYSFEIKSLTNSTQVVTKTFTSSDESALGIVIPSWHNVNVSGEYSNITWSLD